MLFGNVFGGAHRALSAAALVLVLVLSACIVSQRAQSAQERYAAARQDYMEKRANPERYSLEELTASADRLASTMIDLGDAVVADSGELSAELLGLGAGGGVGAFALAALATRLLDRFKRKNTDGPRTDAGKPTRTDPEQLEPSAPA